MDHLILTAWHQAKTGMTVDSLECAETDLYRVLAPKRLQILSHFMAHPGTSLAEAAVWLGCAESRLAEEVDRLLNAGMLEEGLFGLTAAVGLRDPEHVSSGTA